VMKQALHHRGRRARIAALFAAVNAYDDAAQNG